MTKSDQWKRAAIVLRWIDAERSNLDQPARDKRAVQALQLLHGEPPWNYPWSEVVRSLRDRSANKRDKTRKTA